MFCGVSCGCFPPTIYCLLTRAPSHVWGGSTHCILDRVESKAFRLIISPPLTDCLQPLKSLRSVASLSIFYRYFHAYCSSELAACMPPLVQWPSCARLCTDASSNTIQIPYVRVSQYLYYFIPFTCQLWNHLPTSVFPSFYELQLFKRGVLENLSI